jgi:hypothetical protein
MVKTNTATSPGAESGSAIRHSTPKREQPSSSAHSSTSTGRPLKKSRMIHTTNGIAKAV